MLGVAILLPGPLAAASTLDPKPPAEPSWEAVKRHTGDLQAQVTRLAEMVGGHLGDEALGPNDVKAIIEALALQRAVEVFANLVATRNREGHLELVGRSLPWIEEHLQRTEAALAEASILQDKEALGPPSAAHPLSIRSTLAEIRQNLGLSHQPDASPRETLEPPSGLGYVGPEPTDNEFEIIEFNLQRLRAAAEQMGRGKCYRDFWTRNCADALESHALAHQRRSFVNLMLSTRDLLRKYCESPRLASLRQRYGDLLGQLSIRPIVYDYGVRTTPFIDRPELFRLDCAQTG
jgi:hypothetical protein